MPKFYSIGNGMMECVLSGGEVVALRNAIWKTRMPFRDCDLIIVICELLAERQVYKEIIEKFMGALSASNVKIMVEGSTSEGAV